MIENFLKNPTSYVIDTIDCSDEDLQKVYEFLDEHGFNWRSGNKMTDLHPEQTNKICYLVFEQHRVTKDIGVCFCRYPERERSSFVGKAIISYSNFIKPEQEIDFGNEIYSIWGL